MYINYLFLNSYDFNLKSTVKIKKMIRKSISLLCFSLIFMISFSYIGVFLNLNAKTNTNATTEVSHIEDLPSIDDNEGSKNEDPASEKIDEEYPINEEIDGEDISYMIRAIPSIIPLIDDLIDKIQDSNDDCWRKKASNRKNTMINKLNELKELVSSNNFEDAYNKLLHDIKPKLTGLKTDENEDPWGNEEFENPWVVCDELNEEFRIDCNEILSLIENFNQ